MLYPSTEQKILLQQILEKMLNEDTDGLALPNSEMKIGQIGVNHVQTKRNVSILRETFWRKNRWKGIGQILPLKTI